MQSKRAASKEAIKNMHKIMEDEPLEILSDEDAPLEPPKKKYKVSNRKTVDGGDVLVLKSVQNRFTEPTLNMECTFEELSPCQTQKIKKRAQELKDLQLSLDKIVAKSEIIYKGELTSAYQINESLSSNQLPTLAPAPTSASGTITAQQPQSLISFPQQNQPTQNYQLIMDPASGLIVGAVATGTPATSSSAQQIQLGPVQMATNLQPTATSQNVATKRTRASIRVNPSVVSQQQPIKKVDFKSLKAPQTPPMKQNVTKSTKPILPMRTKTVPAVQLQQVSTSVPSTITTSFRPTEANSEGGLTFGIRSNRNVVDLTTNEDTIPDSREISFNKLQGKTYPSLVVVARASMRQSETNQRSKLDMKVKGVLMNPPTKFTEWLIQQGLVKSEQRCVNHPKEPLKLGMYSDVSKFPYSGGYVWISMCCPQKFVSVFSGSIFEGSPHPPVVILKLLYHWACQTNIQNVIQWVKVDNLYVKGIYTWLRSICTLAIQNHVRQLGGPGIRVEVGVISLGTASQDGVQRHVKVEVLGILENNSKYIRLKAVEPLADGDRNFKKRFAKILEPLAHWIHPDSTIITDLTVDRATLNSMGFKNVIQSVSNSYHASNRMIMEYLRRIVPRMFQNTLSLLSRQIIQQFLDELVWREWFGTNQLETFDNLLLHLSEQTRIDTNQNLIVRLNKVAANPFKTYFHTQIVTQPVQTKVVLENQPVIVKRPVQKKQEVLKTTVKTVPPKSTSPDIPEQMVPLEHYYYGTILRTTKGTTPNDIKLSLKCPVCKLTCTNNIRLMSHLFKHAHSGIDPSTVLCRYCLTSCPSDEIHKHIASSHPSQTKHENGFVCLICEMRFANPFNLGKHMSKEHCPSELPYHCGTCGYRCSNHKQAITHFYKEHDNGPTIQCPFCLKSTTVFSSSRNIVQNVNFFIQHLQKHQKKQFAKKCGKCNLWFVQKDVLKDHIAKMHLSQRGKPGLLHTVQKSLIMVPKSKMDTFPNDDNLIYLGSLSYNVPKMMICMECDKPMDSNKHYPSFETCKKMNCTFSTCCSKAMLDHKIKCLRDQEINIAQDNLPYEMFCICGFRNLDGNQVAKHLAFCEKKSAYPSLDSAKAASVTHSMLDVLGLVRKPEEAVENNDILMKDESQSSKADPVAATVEVEQRTDMDTSSQDNEKNENNACEQMEALIEEVDKNIKETRNKEKESAVEEMDTS